MPIKSVSSVLCISLTRYLGSVGGTEAANIDFIVLCDISGLVSYGLDLLPRWYSSALSAKCGVGGSLLYSIVEVREWRCVLCRLA